MRKRRAVIYREEKLRGGKIAEYTKDTHAAGGNRYREHDNKDRSRGSKDQGDGILRI